jgi:hypothetical protein
MNIEGVVVFCMLMIALVLSTMYVNYNLYDTDMYSNVFEGFTDNRPKQINPDSAFDNYNHYDKTTSITSLANGTTFTSENGGTVRFEIDANGKETLVIKETPDVQAVVFTANEFIDNKKEGYSNINNRDAIVFYGPNNATATIVSNDNGGYAVRVSNGYGDTFYNVGTGYNRNPIKSTASKNVVQESYNPFYSTTFNSQGSALPSGIPRSQIPMGQEDLYILKSEVVPPVCPAPDLTALMLEKEKKCPPCPACARCPEPSITCKAVPNYTSMNEYLPAPMSSSDFWN